jgi:uncharacterized CHY-type Zn-finger protein
MKRLGTIAAALSLAAGLLTAGTVYAADTYKDYMKKEAPTDCFESREGYSNVAPTEVKPGLPNVKCSNKTGGVLWWGDPFDGTEPMGDMPVEADYTHEEAVVKPRTSQLKYYAPCTACHNGSMVPYPKSKAPRALVMHQDIVPDALDLQHGRKAIWCLDCHNPRNRDTFIDHNGGEISLNQPQKLCGKCHGEVYSDWRDGIHGKRIGKWEKGGKKRWWVCTECHNPHMVQTKRFQPITPEPRPQYPRTRTNADHEKSHGGGHAEGSTGTTGH